MFADDQTMYEVRFIVGDEFSEEEGTLVVFTSTKEGPFRETVQKFKTSESLMLINAWKNKAGFLQCDFRTNIFKSGKFEMND